MSYDLNISTGKGSKEEQLRRLKEAMISFDAILIGAGAGLSTSAGLTYSGERFRKYFFDFAEKYGISDIYSGGFYPFPDEETRWAWWARHIYFNRYIPAPKPVYQQLLSLLKGKDYFVLTTNVDHQFQQAGFDKNRLFYMQGDYGLFQSVNPENRKTYDNEAWVMRAMEAQGFERNENGIFEVPGDKKLLTRIPTGLIPACPDDGSAVTMNLRSDDSFVEDEGWGKAAQQYEQYLDLHETGEILYLELGVGGNTPVIIKLPFWKMTMANPEAVYACLNYGEAYCPSQIEEQAVCIDDDIGETLMKLTNERQERT
jgi:NAD-dependent SIR2 family protein deacetylase